MGAWVGTWAGAIMVAWVVRRWCNYRGGQEDMGEGWPWIQGQLQVHGRRPGWSGANGANLDDCGFIGGGSYRFMGGRPIVYGCR